VRWVQGSGRSRHVRCATKNDSSRSLKLDAVTPVFYNVCSTILLYREPMQRLRALFRKLSTKRKQGHYRHKRHDKGLHRTCQCVTQSWNSTECSIL